MSTIRRGPRPADQYTIISNDFLRDDRLSFHARGVGAWMLSHVAGWQTTTQQIARQAGIGRDQVRRALRELEDARYLRRTRERAEGGKMASMVYEISCTPWPEENSTSNHGLETQALVDQALASTHYKKTSPKDNITTEDQPSGGEAGASSQPEQLDVKENAMPTAPDPAQAQLFDVPSTEPPAAGPRPKEGAAAVVAAYVESWREHNAEGEPLRADKGRIARDAKALLARGEATQDELLSAARRLGQGTWANIATEVKIIRRGRPGRGPGNVPPLPQHHAAWSQGDQLQEQTLPAHAANPEVAALRSRYVSAGAA